MSDDVAQPASDLKPTSSVVARPVITPRVTLSAWNRLRFVLQGSPTHSLELVNGLAMLVLGVWLLLPLRVLHYDILYLDVAALADEWVWGLIASTLGSVTIGVLLVDGRRWRIVCAMVLFVTWLLILLLIGLSSRWRSPGVPTYAMLAIASGWVYIRLEQDRRRPG